MTFSNGLVSLTSCYVASRQKCGGWTNLMKNKCPDFSRDPFHTFGWDAECGCSVSAVTKLIARVWFELCFCDSPTPIPEKKSRRLPKISSSWPPTVRLKYSETDWNRDVFKSSSLFAPPSSRSPTILLLPIVTPSGRYRPKAWRFRIYWKIINDWDTCVCRRTGEYGKHGVANNTDYYVVIGETASATPPCVCVCSFQRTKRVRNATSRNKFTSRQGRHGF